LNGPIISTGGGRIEMPKQRLPDRRPARELAVPIATALAVKMVALAALYFAFFAAPAVRPTPDGAATAILGLPPAR
jgi:hypothetical protein